MNRTWTPTLLYNSDQTARAVRLAANVAVHTTLSVDSVVVELQAYWGTADTIYRTVTVPNDGQSRRVVLELLKNDTTNYLTTGRYKYTIKATAVEATASDTGSFVVVNRRNEWNKGLGTGWSLGGVEKLTTLSSIETLWIGGDGSTRIYRRSGSSNYWIGTPAVDRPDTLQHFVVSVTEYDDDADTVWTWRRLLPNAAYVEFDNAGRHVATVNSQGLKTRLTYTPFDGLVDSLVLPVPSGSPIVRAYKFEYFLDAIPAGGNRYRTRIRAPTVNGSTRITDISSVNSTAVANNGSVFAIDPRGDTVSFMMSEGTRVPVPNGMAVAVIDRLHHVDSLYLSLDGVLNSGKQAASTSPDDPDSSATTTYCPAERASLSGCSSTIQLATAVRTRLDGPRTDVGDTTKFAINQYGIPTIIEDALGNQTSITYGDSRFPALVTSVIHPNGFTESQAYNSRGLVDSTVAVSPYGGSNAVTKFTWDSSRPLLATRTDPTARVQQFGYDASGNRTWQQLGSNASTRVSFAYNSSNQLEYVQEPGHTTGQRQHLEYDALLGNLSRVTSPIGFHTDYTTDSIGRVTATSVPFDSAGTIRSRQTTTYDIMGRVVATRQDSGTVSYSFPTISGSATQHVFLDSTVYDAEGNPTSRKQYEPTGSWLGNPLSFYKWTYDALGRVLSETGPGGSITYTRDAAGNVTAQGGVSFQYDALGRLARRITPGSSQGASCHPMIAAVFDDVCRSTDLPFPMYGGSQFVVPTDTALFTYDANGNILTANNIDGRISRTYYANGQIKTDTLHIRTFVRTSNPTADFAVHAYALQYEYDLSGRRTKLYHPANLAYGCGSSCYQSYNYDTLGGRLATVTSTRGQTFTFTYDDGGHLASSAGPGGTQQTFTYDLDDRVAQRVDRRGLSAIDTVHHDVVSYDALGRVVRDSTAGLIDFRQSTRNAYDLSGKLAGTEYDQVSPAVVRAESWTVNGLGNAATYQRKSGPSLSKVRYNSFPDSTSRLPSSYELATSTSIPIDSSVSAYDSYGRESQRAVLRLVGYPQQAARIFTWDWYAGANGGTMYGFQRQGPDTAADTWSVLEEYRYDALGRRILLRSRADSTCSANFCKSAMQRFIYDGNALLYEVRVPGANTVSSSALEVDTATGPFYGRIGYTYASGGPGLLALDRDGLTVMPHANQRGLYDAGTDTTGVACCSTIDWVAKNQGAYLDGAVVSNPVGWGGSLIMGHQDQSGLQYLGNRYYDPTSGRFTQADPVGLGGGLNAYGFAGGDPMNFGDPTGLAPCPKELEGNGFVSSGNFCVPITALAPVVVTADPDEGGDLGDSWGDWGWQSTGSPATGVQSGTSGGAGASGSWGSPPSSGMLGKIRSCVAEEGLPATGFALGVSLPGLPVPKGRLGGALGSSRVQTLMGKWAHRTGTELYAGEKVLGTYRVFGAIARGASEAAPYIIAGGIAIDAIRIGACAGRK